MRIDQLGGICLGLVLCATAVAQNDNLTRAEVATVKTKLTTVQKAMGAEPEGYIKEAPEEFGLPTQSNPNQQSNKNK